MSDFFRKLYCKIYVEGKQEFEKRWVSGLFRRVSVLGDVKFYPESQVVNLANDASRIKIGNGSHIFGQLTIYSYGGEIRIGQYCSIGDHSRIVSGDRIEIGDRVLIAHNVNILDNNSHPVDPKERHMDFMANFESQMQAFDLKAKGIKIEDDVWIGFNSTILKGVTIGKGAIIGAGSIVVSDVEPYTINVGNPLRCVGHIKAESMI